MDLTNGDRVGKFPTSLAGAEVSDIDLTEEEIIVGGERLTDERAEQMADDYEANHPLNPGSRGSSE